MHGSATDYSTGMVLATPGQFLGSLAAYMRGHGTHLVPLSQEIASSLAGRVLLTNRLVSLQPFYTRYTPETGDLVLGRVVSVLPGARRWKIDLSSTSFANLALSSINLPDGIQRRKLASDELKMHVFFKEGDLLVAEVQGVYGDGSTSLHTRSLRYGKLRNGRLVCVAPRLVKRGKSHFIRLEEGDEVVEMILGLNGWIWLSAVGAMQGSRSDPQSDKATDGLSSGEAAGAHAAEQQAEGLSDKGVCRDVDAGDTYSDDFKLPAPQSLGALALLSVLLSILTRAYLPISDVSVQTAWTIASSRIRSRPSSPSSQQQQWWRTTMKEVKAEFLAKGILGPDVALNCRSRPNSEPGGGAAADDEKLDEMDED